jgi:hypothetical protein
VIVTWKERGLVLLAAAVIVVREAAVSLLRVYLGMRGVSMPASDIAKVKTGAQLVAITLYLWPLPERAGGARLAALVAACVVAYALSPIDLVPDFVLEKRKRGFFNEAVGAWSGAGWGSGSWRVTWRAVEGDMAVPALAPGGSAGGLFTKANHQRVGMDG